MSTMDTEAANSGTRVYPPEFVAACARLKLRIDADHYQLWMAGRTALRLDQANKRDKRAQSILALARGLRELKGSRNFPGEDPSPDYDRGIEDCVLALEEELTREEESRQVNEMQSAVREWHDRFGVVVGDSPAIRRPELRAALIEEEARETCEAIRCGDLVEAIDGMCDVLYVVFGTAVEFGIDLAPFFAEVHRTNMLKVGGATRDDGKILKPEGWQPPRIAQMLAEMAVFECEGCGVAKQLRNLDANGICETCNPKEVAPEVTDLMEALKASLARSAK